MHTNGIIITKQFISHWNFKRLRGSVGRALIHVCYIFLKSNEEIVVQSPKSKTSFKFYKHIVFFYSVVLFVVYVFSVSIYTFFTPVKVAKLHPVASWLLRGEDAFSGSALMRNNVLFDMPVINLIMFRIVHYSRNLLCILLS